MAYQFKSRLNPFELIFIERLHETKYVQTFVWKVTVNIGFFYHNASQSK